MIGTAIGPEASEAVVARVARESFGRLIACLCARTHDLAAAEDALAQALEMALVQWPIEGVPRVPEAWLLTVARRRLLDSQRRRHTVDAALEDLCLWMDTLAAEPETIPDRRLALMFVCAHPSIEPQDRAPLMLHATLGLSAAQIAVAFWVTPAAMGKRLVRAKARIRERRLRFEVPDAPEWPERLDAVLDALYAAYTRGWKDPTDLAARSLSEEAIWLAKVVASLLPDEGEALGLLALMLFSGARAPARRDAQGQYVPLASQETRHWDPAKMNEANAVLLRASQVGRTTGRYQLEAAIQCAQMAHRLSDAVHPVEIAQLYDLLLACVPSPVVRLNRAVARLPLDGPGATFAAIEDMAQDRRMFNYQPYWAARAHVAQLVGRVDEARAAYELAIGMSEDEALRKFLERRKASLSTGAS